MSTLAGDYSSMRCCWWLAVALLGSTAVATDCPVRLLDLVPAGEDSGDGTEEGLQLVGSGLDYLSQLRSPLFVVPALGVYRGGKSLLLNRLMGLQAPYAGGFGVGHDQQTFTRGIDVCAEEHPGLGTVVWMDTEGLFSAEDARSSYGPKIFSLALLFASSVLLNNVKVFNEQFFTFFAEQQQIARVLKQGLAAEQFPSGALLLQNLSIFWVLQQPIRFDSSGETSRLQLESFLTLPGDDSRARVKRDFNHNQRDVPVASHDSRHWAALDKLADSELLPEYVNATSRLREEILTGLHSVRPLQAEGIAAQLRMYLDLVRTERFSGVLAKEALEEQEIGTLCAHFKQSASALAGTLPVETLNDAFTTSRRDLEPKRAVAVETFHLDSDWSGRLEACLQASEADLRRQNAEAVMLAWKKAANAVAEEGDCFFRGKLSHLHMEYAATYGQTFSSDVQQEAVSHASALQRTRLVECVHISDLLWPLVPWLAWPFCSLYVRSGAISGLVTMALHIVVLAGLYVVLQFSRQLPPYLDVDYPILRAHPLLLDLVMRAPPLVPWAAVARALGSVGLIRSLWKFFQCLWQLGMPAGHGHTVAQMVNLELKVNMLLKRSEAQFKSQLTEAALRAADHFERGEARCAIRALLYAASLVRQTVEEDWNLRPAVDQKLWSRIHTILQRFRMPSTQAEEVQICKSCRDHNIEGLVANGDWRRLLCDIVKLLERAMVQQDGKTDDNCYSQGTPCSQSSASPQASTFPEASPGACSGLFVSTPTPSSLATPLRPRGRMLRSPSQRASSIPTPGSAVEGMESEEEGNSVASSEQNIEEDGDAHEGTMEVGDLQYDPRLYNVKDCGWEVFLVCAVLLVVFAGCSVSAGLLAAIGFLPALPPPGA